jgi:LysR family transcriptional regulator, pca operon transcriptional activator
MTISLLLVEQTVVLGETGNFARAAERLGITQPTLTRNIATLEAKLGVKLFDRGRGGAVPTVFGQAVIDRGRALVRDSDALLAELHALAGLETGRLNIVAGPYAAEDLVGPAVARLLGLRPGVHVRVTVVAPEEVQRELLSGRSEIGVAGMDNQRAHDDLSIVALKERRLYLACRAGHPLAGSRPTVQQVLSYPLVTVFQHGRNAQAAAMGSGDAGATDLSRKGFAPAIEVNSLDTAKQVARRSNALFPGSASMLLPEFAHGELVRLDFDSPELRTRSALVRMRNRTPSPAALKFMEFVRAVEADLIAAEEADTVAAV